MGSGTIYPRGTAIGPHVLMGGGIVINAGDGGVQRGEWNGRNHGKNIETTQKQVGRQKYAIYVLANFGSQRGDIHRNQGHPQETIQKGEKDGFMWE